MKRISDEFDLRASIIDRYRDKDEGAMTTTFSRCSVRVMFVCVYTYLCIYS